MVGSQGVLPLNCATLDNQFDEAPQIKSHRRGLQYKVDPGAKAIVIAMKNEWPACEKNHAVSCCSEGAVQVGRGDAAIVYHSSFRTPDQGTDRGKNLNGIVMLPPHIQPIATSCDPLQSRC